MRILVIRLSSLGDVVLVSVAIEALKGRFPDAELSLLVNPEYAGLYSSDPRISRIICFDPQHSHTDRSKNPVEWANHTPTSLLKLVSSLRRTSFDTIVDLHSNLRSFLVRSLVPAKRKLHYHKRHWAREAMVHFKWLKIRPRHTVDLYLDSLGKLGVERARRLPQLFVDPEAFVEVKDYLEKEGLSSEDILIGVSPGAKWETKRWTVQGFAQVCDRLLKEPRLKVLFLGDLADLPFTNEIISRMTRRPIAAAGRFDIRGLVSAVSLCRLLLTNDSGPMHIATALGVPVVAIFGPTHPKLGFFPLGPRDILLSAELPCSPCSLHGERRCRLRQRRCMEEISPKMVLEAVYQLLPQVDPNSKPRMNTNLCE